MWEVYSWLLWAECLSVTLPFSNPVVSYAVLSTKLQTKSFKIVMRWLSYMLLAGMTKGLWDDHTLLRASCRLSISQMPLHNTCVLELHLVLNASVKQQAHIKPLIAIAIAIKMEMRLQLVSLNFSTSGAK